MGEFKGTKGKQNIGWSAYFSRAIGSGELADITIRPKGNRNSDEEIAICWDKSRINRNGRLKLEEAKYNARLISKAPEMLEQLIRATHMLGDCPLGSEMSEWVAETNQLIKEATEL